MGVPARRLVRGSQKEKLGCMRRIALTVDVEAHPFRASRDHIDRLIWGRVEGREAGIGTMMDIADRHGVPMTFFVDYPEYEVHGEAILDVAREIARRGHDAEPHCHAEYLAKPLFGTNVPDAVRLGNVSRGQADRMAAYLVERHVQALGAQPQACRSRGYELSAPWLDALKGAGVALDASYSLSCKRDPLRLGLRGPFRFSNELLEIPVPFVPWFQGAGPLIPWNFNQRHFLTPNVEENVRRHEAFLNAWFTRHGDDAVATLVMHSWSFWKMDDQGFFTIPNETAVELFATLVGRLADSCEIVSLGQIAKSEVAVSCKDDERVDASLSVEHCPICLEPASHFQEYSGAKRRCPFCGSGERQRSLVELLYAGAFGPGIFQQRDILHIAPSHAEKLLLRRMRQPRITTLDILPGCDVQADLQAMPELEDNSFDIVLANDVFRHVRDLDKALAEIARVLRPGGILLCSDTVEDADYGREITDIEEQTAGYGREKWEQYGIGDFRRFGRKDWETAFAPWFFTRLVKADDRATGLPAWWLACTPKADKMRARCEQTGTSVADAAILRSHAGRIFLDAAQDPVSHFLPDFNDWQHFRQKWTPCDLTWLKENIILLRPTTHKQRQLNKKPTFLKSYPTNICPYEAQWFWYLLPELSQDNAHGDSAQLKYMISEIERWIDTYGFFDQSVQMDRHTHWMVWYDVGVAMRLNFMVYLFLRILPLPNYSAALAEKLFRALLDHFYLLCADHFFTAQNHHGWLQMFGLLSFCRAMPAVRGTEAATRIAIGRTLALCEKLLTPDGMLRMHSSAYQAFVIALLVRMRDQLPVPTPAVSVLENFLEKMRCCLNLFITPQGSLAAMGESLAQPYDFIETEVRSAELRNRSFGIFQLPHSGHAALRLPSLEQTGKVSFLTLSGAFHSITLKHCDDLGIIWSEGRQNVLVDPGMQISVDSLLYKGPLWEKGFFRASPNCIYVESAHAHNVVEINGQTWSRRIPPYGVLPLHGQKLSSEHWLLEGEWQRPEGFRQQRRLILSPGRWLLVLDSLAPLPGAPLEPATFTQWFHLAPAVELEDQQQQAAVFRLSDGRRLHCRSFLPQVRLTCHKGEFSPRLQGWIADTSTTLYPSWALGWHQNNIQAAFGTLFSLVGPCHEGKIREKNCILLFSNGDTERFSLTDTTL